VSPTDPVTIGASVIVLGLVALAATAVPAWCAARVNPLVALRE
jgi:ABC-type antimicrobial peptide transport system permease subunit